MKTIDFGHSMWQTIECKDFSTVHIATLSEWSAILCIYSKYLSTLSILKINGQTMNFFF